MPKMKSKDETPDSLKPYIFHGVDLDWRPGSKEALADCPWCSAPSKFSVNTTNGLWRCLSCAEGGKKGGGNDTQFLHMLFARSDENTTIEDYAALAKARGLSNPDTILKWKVCKSYLRGEWLVPGFGASQKLLNLYRYTQMGGSYRLLGTSGCSAQLFGMNLFDDSRDIAFICEGVWDTMRHWETISQFKFEDGNPTPCAGNAVDALGAMANVVGVPGCGTFHPGWVKLFKDVTVFICFDNDPPRANKQTGKMEEPAALNGAKRLAGLLTGTAKSIYNLDWRNVVNA